PAAVADRVGTSLGGIMIRRLESLARRMEAEMDTSQRNLTRKIADLTSTHQVTWQGQETTLAALPGQVAAAIGARIAAPVEDLASSGHGDRRSRGGGPTKHRGEVAVRGASWTCSPPLPTWVCASTCGGRGGPPHQLRPW
ncbi:MAG: hypothetical protein ACRDY2_09720, partial [Acidimicrobiales bacterium]